MQQSLFISEENSKPSTGLDVLSCVLFSLVCVSNYLLYNAYPLFSWEAAVLTSTFSLMLLLTVLLLKAFRTGWFFYAILFFLFFDLNYGFANRPFWEYLARPQWNITSGDWLSGISGHFAIARILTWLSVKIRHTALMNHVLASLVAAAAAWRFRKTAPGFMVRIFALLFCATLIRFTIAPEPLFRMTRQSQVSPHQNPPGDVFIFILDEHTGIEGIPPLNAAAKNLKSKLTSHYQERGFTLFPRAYSNYFDTHNSIPSILNYSLFDQNTYMTQVRENKLLESLLKRGLQLNIYQSDTLNFCAAFRGRTAGCFQYRANSAGNITHLPLSTWEKTLFLTDSFVAAHQSELLKRTYPWAAAALTGRRLHTRTGPIPVMQVFEQMKKDLRISPQGSVFFAHLLMPHYPYVYDANCRLKPLTDWDDREITPQTSPDKHYEGYAAQAVCLDRKLEDFFKTLDAEHRYENATIVLLSDHGSRITLTPPIAQNARDFTFEDWMSCFSALAAVKKGHLLKDASLLETPLHPERIPLPVLLNGLFQFGSGKDGSEKKYDRVYLRKNWESNEFLDFELPEISSAES